MSPSSSATSANRVERVLAFMVAGVIGVSIIAFFVVMIATASGVTQQQLGEGVWPVIVLFPLIGLPIGILLLIALVIVSAVRRGREARADRE